VARVGSDAITLSNLERWTRIESVLAYVVEPQHPVPSGVVPDPPGYVNCIAYLRRVTKPVPGKPKPATKQLKRLCAEKHERLRRHILDILLIHDWLKDEAAERGVGLTNAEIETILHRVAPTPAALNRYLSITGERLADERLIIERDLFDSKLRRLAEEQIKHDGVTSGRRWEQALIKAAAEFTNKWASRTYCHAGYVVSECSQYKGTRSLVLPRSGTNYSPSAVRLVSGTCGGVRAGATLGVLYCRQRGTTYPV
jgi:hypothetical protein